MRETIQVPQMWRMSLAVRDAALDVAFKPLLPQEEIKHHTFELSPAAGRLEAIEEIVYENPLLLSEFNHTDVILDTRRFTLMPTSWLNDEVKHDMVHALWPSLEYDVAVQALQGTDESLLMAVDKDLLAFLHRTFLEARMVHPVGKVVEYFATKARGNQACMYAHLHQDVTYVVAFKGNTLCIACQYFTPTPDDAAYYILAAAKQHGFEWPADAVHVTGDPDQRQRTIELLQSMKVNALPGLLPEEAVDSELALELLL